MKAVALRRPAGARGARDGRVGIDERNNTMKFADFVCRESVSTELTSFDKESVIREMVKTLLKGGHVGKGEYERIVKAILKREELGSTGIGRGVAVPHTKHLSVDKLIGSVAVSRSG